MSRRRGGYIKAKPMTLRDIQREQDKIADEINGRRPMNGQEMKILEYLAAMDSRMTEAGETMKERLKDVPNGWRQWRLLDATLKRLLLDIYKVTPIRNMRTLQNICDHGEIAIRISPATRLPEHVFVNENDLHILINTSMAAECAVCIRQGKEIDRCPLRQALLAIAPPFEDPPHSCGYLNHALRSEHGNYI